MLESLLERINQQEFSLLSEDIKNSLAEHHLWMQKINLAIAAREPLLEHSFIASDAHEHCHFGQWLTDLLADNEFNCEPFVSINTLHVQLHNQARDLLLSFKDTQSFDEPGYANFLNTQRLFFNSILEILEFSVVSTHQFDPTTKLVNRRSAYAILAHEKQRMHRLENASCCIALADIDFFKAFNDQHGHDVGDQVLEHVASVFNSKVRRYDTVARFGGEEFLFVLPDMNIKQASQTIERVRRKLATSSFVNNGIPLNVTASFGVTQLCEHCDINGSLKRVDVALYKAKELGRNKTVCVDSIELFKKVQLCTIDPNEAQLKQMIQEHCEVFEYSE